MVETDSPIGGGGPIGADGPIGAGPPSEGPLLNTVTIDKWQRPLGARAVPIARAAPQGGQPFVPRAATRDNTVTPDNWLIRFDAPQRRRLLIATQPSFVSPAALAGNTVTLDKWQASPGAKPAKVRVAGHRSALTFVSPAGLAGNRVTIDKWQQPLSVAVKARFAGQGPALTFVSPAALAKPIRLGPGFIAYVPWGDKPYHERRRDAQKKDRDHLRKAIALALEGDPGPLARLTGILIARDQERAALGPRELLEAIAPPPFRADALAPETLAHELSPEALSPELAATLKDIALILAEEDDTEAILLAIT